MVLGGLVVRNAIVKTYRAIVWNNIVRNSSRYLAEERT